MADNELLSDEELLAKKDALCGRVAWASHLLNAFIDGRRDGLGIVDDEISSDPLYKEIKKRYRLHFNELRAFNQKHIKQINAYRQRNSNHA